VDAVVALLSGEALLLLAFLTLTPGPDTFLTLRQALTGGMARAVPTVAGISIGPPVHAAVAGFGLALVLQESPAAFRVLQVAGVGYLGYLALRSLLAAARRTGEIDLASGGRGGRSGGWGAFRDGLATDLLNPKVALFFLGFLPQFIPPGPAFAGTAVLYGIAMSLMAQAQLLTVAALAHRMRDRITSPRFRRGTELVAGLVLLGFAVWMALLGQPQAH
jgi:threonine/homoserine/homoserine lactone efflux protein